MNKPDKQFMVVCNNGEGYSAELYETIEEAVLAEKYSTDWYLCRTINDIGVYGNFKEKPKP